MTSNDSIFQESQWDRDLNVCTVLKINHDYIYDTGLIKTNSGQKTFARHKRTQACRTCDDMSEGGMREITQDKPSLYYWEGAHGNESKEDHIMHQRQVEEWTSTPQVTQS